MLTAASRASRRGRIARSLVPRLVALTCTWLCPSSRAATDTPRPAACGRWPATCGAALPGSTGCLRRFGGSVPSSQIVALSTSCKFLLLSADGQSPPSGTVGRLQQIIFRCQGPGTRLSNVLSSGSFRASIGSGWSVRLVASYSTAARGSDPCRSGSLLGSTGAVPVGPCVPGSFSRQPDGAELPWQLVRDEREPPCLRGCHLPVSGRGLGGHATRTHRLSRSSCSRIARELGSFSA